MAETSPNGVAATAPLSQLHPSTALWRIAKLPVTEIRTRLTAFGLPTVGTKRTLTARLHAHLQTLPASPESPASTGDGSDHGSAAQSDATGESLRHRRHAAGEKERHRRHAAEEKARHGRRSRRRHGHGRPSQEDAETIRALLRQYRPFSSATTATTSAAESTTHDHGHGRCHSPPRLPISQAKVHRVFSGAASRPPPPPPRDPRALLGRALGIPPTFPKTQETLSPLTAHRGTGFARVKLPKGASTRVGTQDGAVTAKIPPRDQQEHYQPSRLGEGQDPSR